MLKNLKVECKAACCLVAGFVLLPAALALGVEALVVSTFPQPMSILFEQSIFALAPSLFGGFGLCTLGLIIYEDLKRAQRTPEIIVETAPPANTSISVEMVPLKGQNNRKNSYSKDDYEHQTVQHVSVEIEKSVSNLQTALLASSNLTQDSTPSQALLLSGGTCGTNNAVITIPVAVTSQNRVGKINAQL